MGHQTALWGAALHLPGCSVPALLAAVSSSDNLYKSIRLFPVGYHSLPRIFNSLGTESICYACALVPYTNTLVRTSHAVLGNFLLLHALPWRHDEYLVYPDFSAC